MGTLKEKIPPQNLIAEQSVLGALMLEQALWDELGTMVSAEDFYHPAHKQVFNAIRSLHYKNQAADLVTVTNWLMEKNQLESTGGAAYLAELMDQTPSTTNAAHYAQIVKDKALLRRLIGKMDSYSTKAYAQEFDDLESFVNEVEAGVFGLASSQNRGDVVEARDVIKSNLKKIEALYTNQDSITGIGSGFEDLDQLTHGFQPGELSVLAARPSMGKTALSLNLALHMSVNLKKTVAYFSVEMVKEQLMLRMLGAHARLNLSCLNTGKLMDPDWEKLISSAAKISDTALFIDETSGISPYEILSKTRRLKASKQGLDIIFVDYLQIMDLKSARGVARA